MRGEGMMRSEEEREVPQQKQKTHNTLVGKKITMSLAWGEGIM